MNVNDNVSVILTQTGADIMNKRETHYSNIIPNFKATVWHENDQYDTQLWCLFEIFGCYIDITCETPFKNNEIALKE